MSQFRTIAWLCAAFSLQLSAFAAVATKAVVAVAKSDDWPGEVSADALKRIKTMIQGTVIDVSQHKRGTIGVLSDVEYPRQTDERFVIGFIEGFTSSFEKSGGVVTSVVRTEVGRLSGYAVSAEMPTVPRAHVLVVILFSEQHAFYVQFVGVEAMSTRDEIFSSYTSRLSFDTSLVPMRLILAAPPESQLVGTWSAKNASGAVGTLVFEVTGGGDFLKNGISLKEAMAKDGGSVTYTYDSSSEPAKFDIVAKRGDGEIRTLLGIVTFLTKDSIKVRASFDGTRPANFDGSDDTFVLFRDSVSPKKPNQ